MPSSHECSASAERDLKYAPERRALRQLAHLVVHREEYLDNGNPAIRPRTLAPLPQGLAMRELMHALV